MNPLNNDADTRNRSLLDHISYTIIEETQRIQGETPSGVYFNKAFSLLGERSKKDIDLEIPHCWYRWGDEVVRACLSNDVKWDHQERTEVSWDGPAPKTFALGNDLKNEITSRIRTIITNYSTSRSGIERMKQDVYSYAPYDFQRTFLNLRNEIDSINFTDLRLEPVKRELIRNLKKKAVEDHGSVGICNNITYDIWSELFDILIESETPDYNLLKNINETYWFEFCYHLRITANDFVPRSIIDHWKENIPYDIKNMYYQLIDLAKEVKLAGFRLSDTLNDLIRTRDKEKKEIDDILLELYDGERTASIQRQYTYRSRLV